MSASVMRPEIATEPRSTRAPNAIAWCVAALLAGALVGLVHDPNYATASGQEPVEEGRNIDNKAVMEEGIDVAASGRVIGLAMLLAAGGLCAVTIPRGTRIRWDGLTLLTCVAGCWALSSLLWSVEPDTTARELVRLAVYTGTAVVMALRFDARTLCFVIATSLGGSVLAAVGYEFVTGGFRPWVTDYRLTGSMHSNVLAVQAAVVALIAYAFALRRDGRAAIWWLVFAAAFAVVFFTKARTAMLTVFAGVATVHIVGRPTRDWALGAACLAAGVSLVLIGAGALGGLQGRGVKNITSMGRQEDTSNLTGRVPLWNFVWRQIADRRVQGHGWGAFWVIDRTVEARGVLGWFPRHSHNAYLQVVVDLGLVGASLVVVLGMSALARAARLAKLTRRAEFTALAAVLVAMFVNGFAESAFVMPRDMGLFSAAVVFGLIAEAARLQRSESPAPLASLAAPMRRSHLATLRPDARGV